MKKSIITILIMLLSFNICSCSANIKNTQNVNPTPTAEPADEKNFEIYLIKKDTDYKLALDDLELEDEPVLRTGDIIRFYWKEQAFVTKNDFLAKELRERNISCTSGAPFAAVVDGQRIYTGKFTTTFSSMTIIDADIIIGIEGLTTSEYKYKFNRYTEQIYGIGWDKSKDNLLKKIMDKRIYNALKNNGILFE